MNAAEQEFVDQMTRKMLVDWATIQIETMDNAYGLDLRPNNCFVAYAISKKWVKTDGSKLLATGFQTAARFLKR